MKENATPAERGSELMMVLVEGKVDFARAVIHDIRDGTRVHDPAQPEGQQDRTGQLFVSMPELLTQLLPDSEMTPEQLIQNVDKELSTEEVERVTELLLGKTESKDGQPLWEHSNNGFTLRVFNGLSNEHAIAMSEDAAKGFKGTADVVVSYQQQVAEVVRSVLKYDSDAEGRISEDCLASGDTIAGVAAALLKIQTIIKPGEAIRIDVVNATAQGILVLKEFSRQMGIELEINAGYLAFGLSKGEKQNGARLHANYITYPQEILERLDEDVRERLEAVRASDGNIYVVGDMGDAARSLPASYDKICPWNRWRNDDHGDRGYLYEEAVEMADHLPTSLFFANGGYLMRAYMSEFALGIEANEVMLIAKRVWSDDERFGYGVLLDNLPLERH